MCKKAGQLAAGRGKLRRAGRGESDPPPPPLPYFGKLLDWHDGLSALRSSRSIRRMQVWQAACHHGDVRLNGGVDRIAICAG